MKDARYFSHDANARNDEKILALRMEHDWKGYGLYWAILEKLREASNYRLSTNYNLLAFDLRTSNELIKSIVTGFGLFTIEDDQFYSQSLCNRMSVKEDASEKAREKALKRWGKNSPGDAPAIPDDAAAMQQHSQGNASKKGIKERNEDGETRDPQSPAPPAPPKPSADGSAYQSLEECKRIALADVAMNGFTDTYARMGLLPDLLGRWLDAFHRQLAHDGDTVKQQKDYRKHFANWIKFQSYTTSDPEAYSPVKVAPAGAAGKAQSTKVNKKLL